MTNSRVVVETPNGFVNRPGDRLEEDRENNMIKAYCGNKLVGAFEMSNIMRIYISEQKE